MSLELLSVETGKETLSDEALFESSIKSPHLFREVLERYQEAFLRKARGILRSEEEAEDAVQETFTKIYLKAGSFTSQGNGSFKSWGYRVLVNTCFSRYQSIKRRGTVQFSEEMEEVMPDLANLGEKDKKELADYIGSILSRMPESAANILSRFYLDGKTGAEIATEDGTTVGAVKTRMYRAKEAFRQVEKNLNLLV